MRLQSAMLARLASKPSQKIDLDQSFSSCLSAPKSQAVAESSSLLTQIDFKAETFVLLERWKRKGGEISLKCYNTIFREWGETRKLGQNILQ